MNCYFSTEHRFTAPVQRISNYDLNSKRQSYAHDTLAGNSRRKLARVIRRWKLANVTCFPALVFYLARKSSAI